MRLPYTDDPPQVADAESKEIVERVRDRRLAAGYSGLLELDRTLLHSPPVADGWNAFLGAVRTKGILPPSIRELIICRVAALNKAEYEWKHHEPILVKGLLDEHVLNTTQQDAKDSITTQVLWIVRQGDPALFATLHGLNPDWAAKAKAVTQYTDAMTKKVVVPVEIWQELKLCWDSSENSNRELVEITATCAAYNCVSRFLVALDVGE